MSILALFSLDEVQYDLVMNDRTSFRRMGVMFNIVIASLV